MIPSGKFWITMGIVLIVTGFILAHLSNAGLINWLYNYQKESHIIFHVIGPILLLLGIGKLLIDRFRKGAN